VSVQLALLLGALLAIATLAYVMYPLVRRRSQIRVGAGVDPAGVATAQPAPRAVSDDEIEAAVRAYRDSHPGITAAGPTAPTDRVTCPTCGPRPEYSPSYCSNCGRPLNGAGGRG
jgi:hypothetical protein